MRRLASRLPMAAAALLFATCASVAQAENDRLNTLLRVASALAGAGAGLQEDFEAPAVPGLTTYRAGQVLRTRSNSWQVESGSVDVLNTRARSEVTAYDGTQLVDLAGSPGPGVMITKFATRVGQTYALTLHYARNSGLGRTPARASVDVLGDRGSVRLHADLVHEPARLAFGAQQRYAGTFVADSARTTLRLTALNGGNAGLTVDGISIATATAEQVAAGSTTQGAMASGGSAAPTGTPTAAAAANASAHENRAAFMVRCKRETIAAYAGAARQAESICSSKWDMVTATAAVADALLSATPAAGARFDVPTARKSLPNVRWRARPAQGQVASGLLSGGEAGNVEFGLTTAPAPGAAVSWEGGQGELIPFELQEALKVRGATLTMIGCLDYGAAEGGRVYRVNAPGKAPFALSIYFRSAAVASQSSSFGASTDVGTRLPTLASLRSDGSEWQASCPQ